MMRKIVTVSLFLSIVSIAFGQLPSPNGQVWREYPVGPTNSENRESLEPSVRDVLVKTPTILDMIKREIDETTWTGDNFGLIATDGQKIFVYHTPAVQQKISETVERFTKAETQKIPFVMEMKILTVPDCSEHADIRKPIEKYLHPIIDSNDKPQAQTLRSHAYWIAEKDIPKLNDDWAGLFAAVQGDPRSSFLTCPKITVENGQSGHFMDISLRKFVTDIVEAEDHKKLIEKTAHQGLVFSGFSLLSADGKTVDTDLSNEFSKITGVQTVRIEGQNFEFQTPIIEKVSISEQGLRWPSDGMLMVIHETKRLSEGRREEGVPFFHKIPFVNRLFMNTAIGRETQTVYSIITVRLADPQEKTALAQIQRNEP